MTNIGVKCWIPRGKVDAVELTLLMVGGWSKRQCPKFHHHSQTTKSLRICLLQTSHVGDIIYIYRIHFPCRHDPTSVDWSQTLTMRRGVSVCPNVSQWRGPKRFHCKLWKQDWKGHMVTQYQAVHAKISYFIVIHSNSKQLVVWHPNSTHAIHALEVDA